MSESFHDRCTKIIGEGDLAGNFAPHVKVWSEMSVRVVIVKALMDYEQHRMMNTSAPQNEKG